MKKLWYITIFILILNHMNISIGITWKIEKESALLTQYWVLVNLDISSLESCLLQSWHSSCHSTQFCLVRQFVFGPFISPGVYKDHVFDINIKILPGEEVCSQALGSRSQELQACGAHCSISLQKSVLPAFRSGIRKLCGIQVVYVSFVAYVW